MSILKAISAEEQSGLAHETRVQTSLVPSPSRHAPSSAGNETRVCTGTDIIDHVYRVKEMEGEA